MKIKFIAKLTIDWLEGTRPPLWFLFKLSWMRVEFA